MTRIPTLAVALSFVSALGTTGCSTTGPDKMNAGQRISERGGEISSRGQLWTEGRHDQTKGQKLVDQSGDQVLDGEHDLKKAQAAVAKAERRIELAHANRINGERLISDGTAKMQKAEADYAAIKNGPSAVAPQ